MKVPFFPDSAVFLRPVVVSVKSRLVISTVKLILSVVSSSVEDDVTVTTRVAFLLQRFFFSLYYLNLYTKLT